MSSIILETLKPPIQLISCIIALFLNFLLIFLIITKSPPKLGTYRYLMCYFCGISIIFASVEIVVEPNIYSRGSAFLMVMDLRRRGMDARVGRLLVCILCACCGVTMYGIVIHFVYRFFALERQGRLRYFKGIYLLFWFALPLVLGVDWVLLCWHLLSINPVSNEYLRPLLQEIYNLPIESAVYSAAVFWPYDSQGNEFFNWYSGVAFINLMITVGAAFSVVIMMGVKSWIKIRELVKHGESTYARNLQMQLYKALMAQTLIPVFLLFIPFGVLYIGPLLHIECEFLSIPLTFIYALYPALDPLPILYFVDNYRNAISEFLCCSCNCEKNVVGPSNENTPEENDDDDHI